MGLQLINMKTIIVDVGATGFPHSIDYPPTGFEINQQNKWDPNLEIYLFEPNPEYYSKLESLYGGKDNYHLYQLALSNKKGTFDFYLTDKNECASLRPPVEKAWPNRPDVTNYQITQVKVDLMKNVLSDLPYISYLKLDTQGTEYEIFEGMGDLLLKTHYIRCEADGIEKYKGQKLRKEIIEFLESKGFKLGLDQRGGDIFFENTNL